MNLLLQIFDDKDAFVKWAKLECLLNEYENHIKNL